MKSSLCRNASVPLYRSAYFNYSLYQPGTSVGLIKDTKERRQHAATRYRDQTLPNKSRSFLKLKRAVCSAFFHQTLKSYCLKIIVVIYGLLFLLFHPSPTTNGIFHPNKTHSTFQTIRNMLGKDSVQMATLNTSQTKTRKQRIGFLVLSLKACRGKHRYNSTHSWHQKKVNDRLYDSDALLPGGKKNPVAN